MAKKTLSSLFRTSSHSYIKCLKTHPTEEHSQICTSAFTTLTSLMHGLHSVMDASRYPWVSTELNFNNTPVGDDSKKIPFSTYKYRG